MKLAENIRSLRRESGMTQDLLAEALGVSVAAVHKWESGKSQPELAMLISIASFFEVSVDALLGYGWESGSMNDAAKKISAYLRGKDIENGLKFAEFALKKHPNSFAVTHASAELYYLAMTSSIKHADRAIELFRESIRLISQNTKETVSVATIENNIAICYCAQKKHDKAIEIFKKNNADGLNNHRIGMALAQVKGRESEALPYLSYGFGNAFSIIYSTCTAYANAYFALGELHNARETLIWLLGFSKSMRNSSAVSYFDRGDIHIYVYLASISMHEGKHDEAMEYLKESKRLALKFDSSPDYTLTSMKFYHGNGTAQAYDDMGEKASDIPSNFIKELPAGEILSPLWQEINDETEY